MKITKKFPFFDGPFGEKGSFVGTSPVASEIGMVHVLFVPINSIKTVTTEYSVKEESIFRFSIANLNIKGTCQEYVVVSEDAHGNSPFFQKINILKDEKLNSYQEKIRDNVFENRMNKNKLKEATDSADRIKHRQTERSRQRSGIANPFYRRPFNVYNREVTDDEDDDSFSDL